MRYAISADSLPNYIKTNSDLVKFSRFKINKAIEERRALSLKIQLYVTKNKLKR